jgi:beta-N-acetylhexosaminidase
MKPAIVGIAGASLSPAESEMLLRYRPAGAILFGRNVQDPVQLRALTAELRSAMPQGAVILVDQEGGRVARLRPPHWRAHPPAAEIGRLFGRQKASGLRAAWLTGALIGADCADAGFDVVCAPVLDLAYPGAHDVIGDRAFGADSVAVARLGRAMAAGLLAAGVQPVGKHAPGHGRARVDSHLALPRVEAGDISTDILPFTLNADLPWAMTAHILYTALDPSHPATLSAAIIGSVIRATGFNGVLVTDDLAMQALTGSPADNAVAALAAGCDIALYCSGQLDPTEALLAACPEISPVSLKRFRAARAMAERRRIPLDTPVLAAERDALLGTTLP